MSGTICGGVGGVMVGAVLGVALVGPSGAASIPAYDRAAFGGWIDVDRDCQNTRAEVLIRDSLEPVTYRSGRECVVESGRWLDPYSGRESRTAGALDIDHRVPLRAAWQAGAWAWTDARRREFANVLEAGHLVVTHRSINRSKGARTPSEWWPPVALEAGSPASCRYADRWIAVLAAWDLWSSPADVAALVGSAQRCER